MFSSIFNLFKVFQNYCSYYGIFSKKKQFPNSIFFIVNVQHHGNISAIAFNFLLFQIRFGISKVLELMNQYFTKVLTIVSEKENANITFPYYFINLNSLKCNSLCQCECWFK